MDYQEVKGAPETVALLDHDRDDGATVAGPLDAATTVAGGLSVREFGGRLEREHDAATGPELWLP